MRRSPVPRRLVLLSTLAVGLAAAAIHGRFGAGVARAEDAGGASAAPAPASAPDPTDPAVLRLALLARLDAQIDAAAAKAHLDARLTLDAVAPIPYLGVDADPVEGGMKLTHIYPGTSAEAAGLRPGDVLLAVRGDRVDSKASLGRAIRRTRPGDTLALRFRRDGAEHDASATLGRRPEEDEDEDEQFPGLSPAAAAAVGPRVFDFGPDAVGSTPAALEPILGGHGAAPRYVVTEEGGAKFLRQDEADATGIRFPMAIVRDFDVADVSGTVRFRFAGGRIDRAAGLVVRFRDAAHYLVARVNAAEGDLRVFRVASGLRRTLPGARVEVKADDDRWHTLSIRAEGAKITATMDDGPSATGYDTFLTHGRVGVWTKSDSRSDFDDLRLEPLAAPAKEPAK